MRGFRSGLWIAGLAALLSLSSGGAGAQAPAPQPGKTYRIGFSQIVDHPALNATRSGFLDGLKDAGIVEGRNLVFEYQSAQGNVGNARDIAQKFVADGVDLLAPCTTPNVQATVRVTRGSTVPVAFGCVTNPVEAGVPRSLDAPTGTNVTGMYGSQPAAELIDLIVKILPKATVIGTVFNGGETNSTAVNAIAKAAAGCRRELCGSSLSGRSPTG